MQLIRAYRNPGYEALADGVLAFFDRRVDLHSSGVSFGSAIDGGTDGPPAGSGRASREPDKVSTDISLVAIDRSDPEAYALADVICRGVTAAGGPEG